MTPQVIRVLLMAQHPHNQLFIQNLLTEEDAEDEFELTVAPLHPAALDWVTDGGAEFDLLLLDFSGYPDLAIASRIRQSWQDIPLVVISDQADKVVSAAILQLGAQDHLVRAHLNAYWLRHALQHAMARLQVATKTRFLASILQNIHDSVIVTDLDGIIRYWNAGATEMFGYRADEMFGQRLNRLYLDSGEGEQRLSTIFKTIRQERPLVISEWEGRRKTGASIWVHIHTALLYDASGKAIGFLGISKDITAERQKRQHREMLLTREQAARQHFLELVDSIEGIVWEAEADPFRCIFISRQVERVLGYSPAQWLSAANFWNDHIHPADRAWVIDFSLRAVAKQKNYQYEYRMIAADGRVLWLKDMITVVVENNQVVKLRGVMFDITERKQADEQLQRYTHTLEALNQIHLSLAAELDLEKLVQLVTDVATDLSGAQFGAFFYNEQSPAGETYALYTISGVPRELFLHFPMPRNTAVFGPTFRGEGIIRSADITQDLRYGHNLPFAGLPAGHLPVCSYLAVPVVTQQGEVLGGLFFGHSEPGVFTKEAEKLVGGIAAQAAVGIQNAHFYTQIKEREERFRQLIEDAADGIVVGDRSGICREVNTALCRLLGYTREELIGRQLTDLVPPADIAQIAAAQAHLQRGQVYVAEWTFVCRTGDLIVVESSVKMLSDETWQAIVRDITQRRRIEERMRQQDRLAVVGQLAAGIAHDFNNILSVIILYTQLLRNSPGLGEEPQQRLQTICEQAQRAAHLTAQILDFSRQSVLERQPVELKSFLSELVALLTRTLPAHLHLQLNCEDKQLLIKADVTRLQQVFMNLAVNARDAMPNGGTLSIQVSTLNYEANQRPPMPDLTPGQWIRIVISDTGEGIRPDDLSHIFEPFFSTKARDKGTGLGLAQVYGIIKQHDGFIDIASQLGQGASFTLYLPALLTPGANLLPLQAETTVLGQGEIILVVEDDPSMREVMSDILHMLNYQVLMANNGQDALKLFEKHMSTIALVLSDLVMPLMDGR
ncbi:MAG: PAS domain S-box protein, partial [Chloroflexi bacterium]|nr:PAS domain S-box protein [Chloroflexota bacterium]